MYQMCFVCCPVCGKIEIVFVEVNDWLMTDVADLPCVDCSSEPGFLVKRAVDAVFAKLGIEAEDSDNG